ncbi:MAG: mitochondrial peripheral inner membrane protein [Candelina mexicana]|nr:MAG: mitochondrial peripheral inner membrane protein [Candelina mexicana]
MRRFSYPSCVLLQQQKLSSSLVGFRFAVHNGREASTSAKGPLPAKNRRWPYFVAICVTAVGTFVTYKSWKESTSQGILQQQTFTPFTIISKEPVSSTSTIFTLRPTNAPWSAKPYEYLWKQGVWSILVKQPQLQIARAYTPLPPQATSKSRGVEESNGFRFLIRKEDGGEVSSYLHSLPFGATVELRGPNPEFDIPKDVGEVLFLAGGTGVAPALQAAHAVLSQESDRESSKASKIHILWANRRREDCVGGANNSRDERNIRPQPQARSEITLAGSHSELGIRTKTSKKHTIIKELEALQQRYPNRITVDYFVDEEGTFITGDVIRKAISNPSAASRHEAHSATEGQGKKLVMLSGPDGFVSTLAGPKVWEGGQEVQGRLGGVLSRQNLQGWTVWKL